MEYPSAIKYNEILLLTTICTWKVLCLLKYQRLYFIPYMLNLKNKTKQKKPTTNEYKKNTQNSDIEYKLMVTRGNQFSSVQLLSHVQLFATP